MIKSLSLPYPKTNKKCTWFLILITVNSQVRDGLSGPAGLLSDLTANEKTVHADFYNKFGDLFDDTDLN